MVLSLQLEARERIKYFMFELNKKDYLRICDECMLNDEYSKLLEMKIKGYSRAKMAIELNVSESTLDIMISKLKKKIRKII